MAVYKNVLVVFCVIATINLCLAKPKWIWQRDEVAGDLDAERRPYLQQRDVEMDGPKPCTHPNRNTKAEKLITIERFKKKTEVMAVYKNVLVVFCVIATINLCLAKPKWIWQREVADDLDVAERRSYLQRDVEMDGIEKRDKCPYSKAPLCEVWRKKQGKRTTCKYPRVSLCG
ncbi:Hypothetical predicted protein [Paramuricea clavata]|uniref:Uncharacterized protein n=1 Tax=Paramuricea clavata TaxID=317549 RepID=A0A6S7IIG5_PARCT|nr:Hypothetical predicted protein [Paramuricea clavata]